jgi:hypothetical protein
VSDPSTERPRVLDGTFNPHPIPAHLAGIAVFVERVEGGRLHLTLWQTGPGQLDAEQSVDLLRGAVDIAERQREAGASE